MDAYDEAYDRREDLEEHKDQVDECLYDLPDKACALNGNCSNDDFPVIHACISTVVDYRDRDYGDACEDIRRQS